MIRRKKKVEILLWEEAEEKFGPDVELWVLLQYLDRRIGARRPKHTCMWFHCWGVAGRIWRRFKRVRRLV